MSKNQLITRCLLLFGITALLITLIIYFAPTNSPTQASAAQASAQQPQIQTVSVLDSPVNSSALALAAASQQDTQINCQLHLNAHQQLLINEQTRDCFEYFISQYGEKSLEQIQQDFRDYVKNNYPSPAREQILELWQRYIAYRNSMGEQQAPTLQAEDPAYFQQLFKQQQDLRKRYFSVAEIEALFGSEDQYHLYTLKRLSILDNNTLDPLQKSQQLQQLFQQLPSNWQDNLKQLSQLDDLKRLSSELKSRGGTATQLHQLRTHLVGAAATTRLEQLDQQRSTWKQQVEQYLLDRDQISQSGLSPAAKAQAIQQLKDQRFNTPQQQLRLSTFEAAHQQGATLPFAEP